MKLFWGTGAPFRSDRSWRFDLPATDVWARIARVEDYCAWWPWLEHFRPAGGFRSGAIWDCKVAPPVPYRVRFSVLLEQVEPCTSVTARVRGDVEGRARLTFRTAGAGCVARLRSDLVPANAVLRSIGFAARPVVRWSHDWVLDQGRSQFVERALADAGPTDEQRGP